MRRANGKVIPFGVLGLLRRSRILKRSRKVKEVLEHLSLATYVSGRVLCVSRVQGAVKKDNPLNERVFMHRMAADNRFCG